MGLESSGKIVKTIVSALSCRGYLRTLPLGIAQHMLPPSRHVSLSFSEQTHMISEARYHTKYHTGLVFPKHLSCTVCVAVNELYYLPSDFVQRLPGDRCRVRFSVDCTGTIAAARNKPQRLCPHTKGYSRCSSYRREKIPLPLLAGFKTATWMNSLAVGNAYMNGPIQNRD